jgi:glucose/arabinose dehydrogenase
VAERRRRVLAPALVGGLVGLSGLLTACGSFAPTAGFTFSVQPGTSAAPTVGLASASPTARPRPTLPAADVGIKTIASGLPAPDGLIGAPDDSGRSFVIDQTGKVFIIEGGVLLPQPFLDLSAQLVALDPSYDERGLLGLAFDPKFAQTGRVFVSYTAKLRAGAAAGQDHTDVISSFTVKPSDPNQVDPVSERTILQFEQPQPNHNGGGLGFGPDGDLYIGVGDGGNEGDIGAGHSAGGNAQDTSKLNGKILRIDVSGAAPYTIPPDNPYARGGGRPEIYALGLRNPWRFSWEPAGQHRLLIDDVGWGRYEEVDVGVAGGNYGWPIREGEHCLDVKAPLSDVANCASTDKAGRPLIGPVLEYSHTDVGIAIVGGQSYQGSAIPSLAGKYVFADLSRNWTGATPIGRGSILAATPQSGSGTWAWQKLSIQGDPPLSFVAGLGQGGDGELYLLTRDQLGATGATGHVLEIVPGG